MSTLALVTPSGSPVTIPGGAGAAKITIGDFNIQPVIQVMDAIMTQSNGSVNTDVVFNIGRGYPFGPSTVTYAISAGTAVEDTDYSAGADALTGTVSFADGEIYKTVSVRTLNSESAGSRTITCTLSSPVGCRIDDGTATGTIQKGAITTYTDADTHATISTALTNASPGDALLLARGDNWVTAAADISTEFFEHKARGTAANPIILGAYGVGADPIVNGMRVYAQSTDTAAKDVIIQDLHFDLTVTGTRVFALNMLDGNTFLVADITVQRCFAAANGLNKKFYDAGGDGVTLQFNEGEYFGGSWSEGQVPNATVRFNKLFQTGTVDTTRDWGIYMGNSNAVIEYNYLDGNFAGQTGIKFKSPINGILRGNIVLNSVTLGLNTGSVGTIAATGNLIEGNIIWGCDNPARVQEQGGNSIDADTYSATIRNNIFEHGVYGANPTGSGCLVVGGVTDESQNYQDFRIENNLFIAGTNRYAMYFQVDVPTGTNIIQNNICYHPDGNALASIRFNLGTIVGAYTMRNNLVPSTGNSHAVWDGVGNYASIAAFQVDYPAQEANSVEDDDPEFVNFSNKDFHLQSTSPAKGAGYDNTADVTTDIEGATRTAPVDMGAFKA